MKRIQWTENAWSDYVYWQDKDDAMVEKINLFIKECLRTPFSGLGKPEALRGQLAGLWSRRLTSEHRFVYFVDGQSTEHVLHIIACRLHYETVGTKKQN